LRQEVFNMKYWKAFIACTWLGAMTVVLLPTLSDATPLFPDVRASRSVSGEYLVILEQRFDKPDANGVRQVLRSTYAVLRSEPFPNSRDRLQMSASFWSGFGWQVTLTGSASQRTFLPLVANDGETIALVEASGPVMARDHAVGDTDVMRIYKERGNKARLVRTVTLSDVWSHAEIDSNTPATDMGNDPTWYAGGSLEFSSDDQFLIFRSRWNDKVRIKLADGSTAFEHK
jgi:hypothetical protein